MSETASPKLEGGFRTLAEQQVGGRLQAVFERSSDPWEKRMENFAKYVKRQTMTRVFAQYEIFKRILNVKGSVVECGVLRGGTLFGWAHMSAVLEPNNITRRIYGFDTFGGFPTVSERDRGKLSQHVKQGDLDAPVYDELRELIEIHDSNRFLGHVDKVHLIKGDASKTVPAFIEANQHLVVSLLFLDFDLYEPTVAALRAFVPRMPRGAVIAFDELDNPLWPGETAALVDELGVGRLRLQRLEFDPYIGFAVLE